MIWLGLEELQATAGKVPKSLVSGQDLFAWLS